MVRLPPSVSRGGLIVVAAALSVTGLAAREWDLLVVGGGIHGVAAAWDAAQRSGTITIEHRRDLRLATSHATRS